jgi:hypothetical protein
MGTEGVKELLEEVLDGKFLSWFSVWVKFFDNFFHGLFFDSVKGLPVHFLNLLHIFVWVRHNFNLTPKPATFSLVLPITIFFNPVSHLLPITISID